MRTIPTGLLLVTCCGLTACANQVDDFGLEEHIGSVSQADAPTSQNGLDVYYTATSRLFTDSTVASSLINNWLRGNSLTPNVYLEICNSPAGTGSDLAFHHIVKCALPTGSSVSIGYCGRTYNGKIGLTPGWATNSCGTGCQQWVSACVLAHSNFAGETVSIQVDGSNANLTTAHDSTYNRRESAFWGNLFNYDGTDAATLVSRRRGCYDVANADATYTSPVMGGTMKLLSRVCGYYNGWRECEYCSSGTTAESANACTDAGTNGLVHFLGNLTPISAQLQACGALCTTNSGGYYQNCSTNTADVGYGREITVWRQ